MQKRKRFWPTAKNTIEVYSRADRVDKRELKPEEWFLDRIGFWQKIIGLNHWKINVKLRPRMKGNEAFVKSYPTLLEADITFRQDILIARGDSVIVHELLHVLTDDWAKAIEAVIIDMVPKNLQSEARKHTIEREELAIEALTQAFIRSHGENRILVEARQ